MEVFAKETTARPRKGTAGISRKVQRKNRALQKKRAEEG